MNSLAPIPGHCRPRVLARGFIALAALSACAGGAAAFGQATVPRAAPRTRATGATAGARAATSSKPKQPPKDPRQMAEQLVGVLRARKMPPQIYANYSRIYYEFAAKEKRRAPSSQQAAAYQVRLVQHLQHMGSLLQRMGEAMKVRQAIQKGASELPPEDRQPTFAEAGRTHNLLLQEFIRKALLLPRSRVRPVAASGAAPTRRN